MEQQTIEVITQCAQGAHENTMRFPDIVQNLAGVGVTGYHTDYLRAEITYYDKNDESHVLPLHLPAGTIAADFNGPGVAASVRASQTTGLPYTAFLAQTMQAGCAGYVVYIEGQRVVYLGRQGDMHIEYFPGSPGAMAQRNL